GGLQGHNTHFTNGSSRNCTHPKRRFAYPIQPGNEGRQAGFGKGTMQSDSGLLQWLKVPFLYNLFGAAVGANALRRRLVQNHVQARSGDKVIDIGCGSAQALEFLPDVNYIGLDVNPDYIAFARRTYGSKGTFVVGDVRSLNADSRFHNADIVMALGV